MTVGTPTVTPIEEVGAEWGMPRLSWNPVESQSADVNGATVSQAIKADSRNWSSGNVPVTYTRYAASLSI